jgi:hypothetical protein
VRVDARSAEVTGAETVVVRLVLSEVSLIVPSQWSVTVNSAGLVGVAVRDYGPLPAGGPKVHLELTGLFGSLTIDRR